MTSEPTPPPDSEGDGDTVPQAPWPFEELADRYELAYAASADALGDQRDRIDEMRGRAITLLSVAVGVLAFLGERLFDSGASRRLETGWGPFNSHAAVAVSVAAFLVVVISAVWVWWPVKGSFTLSGKQIITDYIDTIPSMGKGEMLRDLALWNSIHVESNRKPLLRRQRAIAWAMVSLGLQLVMLLLAAWDLVQ